jgi:hypothetical protein
MVHAVLAVVLVVVLAAVLALLSSDSISEVALD